MVDYKYDLPNWMRNINMNEYVISICGGIGHEYIWIEYINEKQKQKQL